MNIRVEHIQAILANPFYAITVAPHLVEEHKLEISDEQWVQTNARLVQDLGAEAWLAQALAFLQSGDVLGLSDPRMNPCHAVNIASIFREDHEPFVSHQTWVQSNALLMQEMGVEQWLAQMLAILEGDARHQRSDRLESAVFSRQKPARGQARQNAAEEEETARVLTPKVHLPQHEALQFRHQAVS